MRTYKRIMSVTYNKITNMTQMSFPQDVARAMQSMGTNFVHLQLEKDGRISLVLLSDPNDAPKDNGVTIEEWVKEA